MGRSISVLLVDDHPPILAGLQHILRVAKGVSCVGVASDGQEAIRLAEELRPDVAVVDASLPIGLSGPATTRALLSALPDCQVVAYTGWLVKEVILEMVEAGALGCAHKTESPRELIAAIRDVHVGKPYHSPRMCEAVMEECILELRKSKEAKPADDLPQLTLRERHVHELSEKGMRAQGIADRLGLCVNTVYEYRRRIKKKLNGSK